MIDGRGVERPLDTVEHVFALLEDIDACNAVALLVVEGELSEEACRAAVRALPSRHPRLATHIVRDGDARAFVTEGTAPIPFVVSAPTDRGGWPAIVEAELCDMLPSDVLFRVRLVPGRSESVVLVHGDHAAADFLSMARVGHDVVAMADGATLPPVPPGAPLDPRMSDRWESRPKLDDDVAMLPFRARAPRKERRTRVSFRSLPKNDLDALIARARQEGASMGGLLTVVATDALAAWPGAAWGHRGVRISTSISARKLCDPPISDDELGCFVSHLETARPLDPSPGPIWPRAREEARRTKERVTRGEWQAPLRAVAPHLASFGRKLQGWADDDVGQGRDTVLDVVSLGVVPLEPLRVTEIYGVVSQRGFGNCLQLTCGTWNGTLWCSLAWTAPLVGDADAHAYFDRVMAALASL